MKLLHRQAGKQCCPLQFGLQTVLRLTLVNRLLVMRRLSPLLAQVYPLRCLDQLQQESF